MDFLVLFIALVVPNVIGSQYQGISYGMTTVHAIVFLFGYEVLLGELRKEFDGVALATIVTLLTLSARGFFINL